MNSGSCSQISSSCNCPIHLCKTSQLFILKTRLGDEIYLSDINMHIRAIRNEKDIDLVKYQTHA